MKIHWHGEAIFEADAAASYYKDIQHSLRSFSSFIKYFLNLRFWSQALRFLDELEDAIQRIQRHPQRYRQIEGNVRKSRIPHFPFAVIFRLQPDAIEIAVMHLRRLPGYWKQRS